MSGIGTFLRKPVMLILAECRVERLDHVHGFSSFSGVVFSSLLLTPPEAYVEADGT